MRIDLGYVQWFVIFVGISRDHWHKRRKTGGKRKPIRKKRKHELGRPAANTKVGYYFFCSFLRHMYTSEVHCNIATSIVAIHSLTKFVLSY